MQITARDWQVLLIGGNSGAGKTTVSQQLARHFGASTIQLDDFRLVLKLAVTPETHPLLYYFERNPDAWKQPTATLLADYMIAAGAYMSRRVEVVVAHHVATHAPLIFEGDGFVPAMTAQTSFADFSVQPGDVCAVYIIEDDGPTLMQSMTARGRGYDTLPKWQQFAQMRVARDYGGWLRAEAGKHGLPVLESRPVETLFERVLAVLERRPTD